MQAMRMVPNVRVVNGKREALPFETRLGKPFTVSKHNSEVTIIPPHSIDEFFSGLFS